MIESTRYPLEAQRDPVWARIPLGHGPATIGGYGCVITSLAMMLKSDPLDVNARLLCAGAFSGANISVQYAPYEQAFGGRLRHVGQSRLFLGPVPEPELQRLRLHILTGQPALVMVDFTPIDPGLQTHFMLGGDVATDGEVIVWDPWFTVVDRIGAIHPILRNFWRGIYGKNSADAIYRYDLFEVKR